MAELEPIVLWILNSCDPIGERKSRTEVIVARDHIILSIGRRWLNGYGRKRQQVCRMKRLQSQPHGRGGNNNKFYLSVKLLMYWFIQCAAQVSAAKESRCAPLFRVQQMQKPTHIRLATTICAPLWYKWAIHGIRKDAQVTWNHRTRFPAHVTHDELTRCIQRCACAPLYLHLVNRVWTQPIIRLYYLQWWCFHLHARTSRATISHANDISVEASMAIQYERWSVLLVSGHVTCTVCTQSQKWLHCTWKTHLNLLAYILCVFQNDRAREKKRSRSEMPDCINSIKSIICWNKCNKPIELLCDIECQRPGHNIV